MAGRRLGRGLQFLLSDRTDNASTQSTPKVEKTIDKKGERTGAEQSDQDKARAPDTPSPAAMPVVQEDEQPQLDATREVEISRLTPNPHQPRKVFREEELQALSDSIRSSGILQPILVRPQGDDFEIVAGERRYRAAKRIGLEHVPVLVREVDDLELRLFALVENLQRSDLDPIEKARSFKDIKDATGWTHVRIADAVGFDRSHVTNFLRLLDLEAPIQKELREGRISMGHARALLAASPDRRLGIAARIHAEGLSVRDIERIAKQMPVTEATASNPEAATRSRQPAWANEMQQNLIEALGCRVQVKSRAGKAGRIILEIGNRAEFDRVYEVLLSTMPGSNEDELIARKAQPKSQPPSKSKSK